MRSELRRLLVLLATALPLAAAAQDRRAQMESAQKLYEAGDCAGALAALPGAGARPSPRVESLRGLCLYATGDLVGARVALRKYEQMVPAAAQSSPAHQAIAGVIAELDRALQEADRRHASELQNKRMAAAEARARATQQRLDAQRQRAQQDSGQQLAAIARAPDFDASMRAAVGRQGLEQAQAQVQAAASTQAASAARSLVDVFSRYQGRPLAFHPFGTQATAKLASFTIESVALNGYTLDYRLAAADSSGRRLSESGTISGLDLSRVTRYTVQTEGEVAAHLLEFESANVWRRGGARWADNARFDGDLTSVRGESQLRLLLPAADAAAVQAAFNALIDAAKTGRAVR